VHRRQPEVAVDRAGAASAVKDNRREGTVAISCRETPRPALRIEVRDTGHGIPADKLERLFTPFDHLGAEESTEEGTGLGLALAKRLAEVMGGTMGVESTVELGSTFWLELELDMASTATAEPARPQRPARPHLPDLRGEEVLRMLRRDPRTEAVPVVTVSADATPGQADRLRGEGAQEYLTKPLEVRRLLEVLRDHLPTAQAVSRDGPRPGPRPGGRGPSPTASG
jgi:hypothetical protein